MYEREKPYPPEDYVRVNHLELKEFVKEIFEALNVPPEDAEVVADVLVKADLFGISSHGVQRVGRYVGGIRVGNVNVRPRVRVVRDLGATALIDADNGLGQPVSVKAMKLAINKARDYGVGLVLVRRSNHFGIAGYYSLIACEEGFIGVTITNSENLVAYVNTLGRTLGTNPVAIAVPKEGEPPFILFDAATSVVPVGKVEIYSKVGKEVPPGWVIDDEGNLLSGDAKYVLKMIKEGRASLLPLGGLGEEFGGHKGSGIAFMIDLIAGVLSGAAWGYHVGYTIGKEPANVGHAFLAINIEAFMSREEFIERVMKYVSEVKSLRKHPKADRVWVPGEKAWLTMRTRVKLGIPLHKNVYRELISIAEEVGVRKVLKPVSS